MKELFREQPWLIEALNEEGFPKEVGTQLNETREELRAGLQTIDGHMKVLITSTVDYVKRQLSNPEECEKRLKPFNDRKKE